VSRFIFFLGPVLRSVLFFNRKNTLALAPLYASIFFEANSHQKRIALLSVRRTFASINDVCIERNARGKGWQQYHRCLLVYCQTPGGIALFFAMTAAQIAHILS
jgi:hypothetical protein